MATLASACSGSSGGEPDRRPYQRVEVADVSFEVPQSWTDAGAPAQGFGAGLWLSEPVLEGTSLGVSVDVACTGGPDVDASEALSTYLDGPQWRDHETLEREAVEVEGAATAESFRATYVVPIAATGRDGELTRRGVLASRDGVAALVLVEGLSEAYDNRVADRVVASLRFDAATEARVAECADG